MRRSRTVNLAVVSALAAAFSGCMHEKKESVYCVDRNQRVVEYDRCNDEARPGYYSYWYGGADTTYRRGETVSGGTEIDASNKAANASRGGFGAAAAAGAAGAVVVRSSGGS